MNYANFSINALVAASNAHAPQDYLQSSMMKPTPKMAPSPGRKCGLVAPSSGSGCLVSSPQAISSQASPTRQLFTSPNRLLDPAPSAAPRLTNGNQAAFTSSLAPLIPQSQPNWPQLPLLDSAAASQFAARVGPAARLAPNLYQNRTQIIDQLMLSGATPLDIFRPGLNIQRPQYNPCPVNSALAQQHPRPKCPNQMGLVGQRNEVDLTLNGGGAQLNTAGTGESHLAGCGARTRDDRSSHEGSLNCESKGEDEDDDDDDEDDDDDNGGRRRTRKTKIPKTVSRYHQQLLWLIAAPIRLRARTNQPTHHLY